MNMNDLFKEIMGINLDSIKAKLMHVNSGEGWNQQKADSIELEYRRFLCLMKMYPTEATAPQVDVDTFWHYHILDTMKYAEDCQQAFGYFLHHYPYVGMRGDDDEEFRLDCGARMQALYEATFGEAYPVKNAEKTEPAQATDYRAGPDLTTAHCGAAVKAATAHCGAAVKAQTAFCGAAIAPATGKQTADAALAV